MCHPNKCDCKLCVEWAELMLHIDKIPEAQKEFFMTFIEKISDERMDAKYNQAILDGSWPSSVEILECSLEDAKKRREIEAGK